MKCMLQRVYFVTHFSGVAQKMIEKLWHLSEIPYAEAFKIYFLDLLLENQISAAVPRCPWCRVEMAEDESNLLLCSPSVANKSPAQEILATRRSLPVQSHCGVGEPALTSLSFCLSCFNGQKEGLSQKEGPSLFSAIILLFTKHKKKLF